jgi:glycosyltransferase involved in cell wall biosynthesis
MFAYTEYITDPRVRREAQALAMRGDTVDFLCLRQPPVGDQTFRKGWFTVEGVNVCQLPFKKYQGANQIAYLLSYVIFTLIGSLWLTGLFLRKRYQLIQVHTMPDFLVFAALIPRILGCKVILDMHDLTSDLYSVKFRSRWMRPLIWGLRLQERLSAGLANRVITVHEPYRQILIQRGIRPSKVSVLMNAPDDRIFSLETRTTGKLPAIQTGEQPPFVLVYHGTIAARYGLDVMLRAVALLRQQGVVWPLRLVIYGKGDDLARLRGISTEMGLDEIVYFHGKHVPTEQLPALLAQADLAVVPNLANPFTEYVLPTKLMEYAALGIPSVMARTLVVSQYFDDEMVAYFEPGNAEQLAAQITTLARDPAQRRAMARIAHQRFTQRYGWPMMRQSYYDLVDALCHRQARRQPVLPLAAPEPTPISK